MGCARCHDHKFDPITQREFYQVLAYFNNLPELGRVRKRGNSPPLIMAPTPDERRRMEEADRELAAAQRDLAALEPQIAAAQTSWEASFDSSAAHDWSYPDGLVVYFPFDSSVVNAVPAKVESKLVTGEPHYESGIVGQAIELDGQQHIEAGNVADYAEGDRFSYGAWVLPEGEQDGTVLSRMDDEKLYEGYDLRLVGGKVTVYMGNRELDDSIRLETVESLPPNRWHHLMVTYDGSGWARGVNIYVDGARTELIVRNDRLNNPFRSGQPLRIGSRQASSRFRGRIDEARVYDHELSHEEVQALASSEPVEQIVAIPADERTPSQRSKLRSYFMQTAAPDDTRLLDARVKKLRVERQELDDAAPTVMVMQEQEPRADTFILQRGEYDKPGERVERGLPASLPSLPPGASNDRLGFARWLVDPSNPLCARVTVNRFWEMLFGVGLVKTSEDFGTQGEPPSHPELLDWLATEFVRIGWDVKALQKLILCQRHLPTGVARRCSPRDARPREPLAGAGTAIPTVGRHDPRCGAGGLRSVG